MCELRVDKRKKSPQSSFLGNRTPIIGKKAVILQRILIESVKLEKNRFLTNFIFEYSMSNAKQNATALITGSYGGLGTCFVRLHASAGGNLILVGRSEQKLREQAEQVEQ